MTISQYLLIRLQELGIRHIFGVPGDFNLWFMEEVSQYPGIDFVGCCNELNASYAADGYARVSGAAAMATTYGVGELAGIAGIAGAYAEKIPIVCITGAPPLSAIEDGSLLHHTLADGNYQNMMNCYSEFTVAQARITYQNAATEIDRVLTACWREKRPVYLQIPSDLPGLEISERPSKLLPLILHGDPQQTQNAAIELAVQLDQAKRPAFLIDADVDRFELLDAVLGIAEKRNIPIAHLVTARGVLADSHPLNIGCYKGAASSPQVKRAVEEADLLLSIGVRLTDVATGLFSHHLNSANIADIQSSWVRIVEHRFDDVQALELLLETANRLAGDEMLPRLSPSHLSHPRPDVSDAPLNQDRFWDQIQSFLEPRDIIISDTGTAGFASSALTLPDNVRFLSQPIWGALGFGLPATLGAGCADRTRRLILFVGDGGLQMSVQELSTILWSGLKPIIFLLNNDGYTIERLILGSGSKYNDISPWRYSLLPAVFQVGDQSLVHTASTGQELVEAISKSHDRQYLHLIEVILPRLDAPSSLVRFARKAAEFDFPKLFPSDI